jgi:hypothetical protein
VELDGINPEPAEVNPAQANVTVVAAPRPTGIGIWRTVRDYILWSHERGTIQYDVMVTLILLFVFLSPYWINFKDKPVEHNPRHAGAVVLLDGQGGLIYEIEASAVSGKDDVAVRNALLQIIEPISGEVSIAKVETVRDGKGRVLRYRVWAAKE